MANIDGKYGEVTQLERGVRLRTEMLRVRISPSLFSPCGGIGRPDRLKSYCSEKRACRFKSCQGHCHIRRGKHRRLLRWFLYSEANKNLLFEQNKNREYPVPEEIIFDMMKHWEVPTQEEAHSVLYNIL